MGVFILSTNQIIELGDKRFWFLVMKNKIPIHLLLKMKDTPGNVSPH